MRPGALHGLEGACPSTSRSASAQREGAAELSCSADKIRAECAGRSTRLWAGGAGGATRSHTLTILAPRWQGLGVQVRERTSSKVMSDSSRSMRGKTSAPVRGSTATDGFSATIGKSASLRSSPDQVRSHSEGVRV